MFTQTPSDTLRDAADIMAATLLEYCDIEAVHLFGSVARRQARATSDVDLILNVDEAIHEAWLQSCAMIYASYMGPDTPVYFGYNSAIRFTAACKSIPRIMDALMTLVESEEVGFPFDILVLPTNWRDRLPELQSTGEHRDPHFMERIDEDALLIASKRSWTPPTV